METTLMAAPSLDNRSSEGRPHENKPLNLGAMTTDGLERLLVECERSISRLRTIQARIVSEVDLRQVAREDGARTLDEWVSGRIDIDPGTAATLRRVGNNRELQGLLEEGITFDRVTVLAETGLSDPLLHLDLAAARRFAARHHRITRRDEFEVTAGRYLLIQPNLDETSWRLHGLLPAVDGALVQEALDTRADQIALETGSTEPRAARRVDALVSLCTSNQPGDGEGSSPVTVTVVVEAKTAAPTNGEAGGWIVSGPRVGPATLEQLLCETVVEVTAVTEDGQPLAIGTATTTIPPRLRRFILARDDGCVIDGCSSTYRLQPHHIRPRHQGGNNHPDNLATLCWHHHHTVIHGHDYRIDPDSPPGRRRLLPPDRDPPG
jgi:hypothetical protein